MARAIIPNAGPNRTGFQVVGGRGSFLLYSQCTVQRLTVAFFISHYYEYNIPHLPVTIQISILPHSRCETVFPHSLLTDQSLNLHTHNKNPQSRKSININRFKQSETEKNGTACGGTGAKKKKSEMISVPFFLFPSHSVFLFYFFFSPMFFKISTYLYDLCLFYDEQQSQMATKLGKGLGVYSKKICVSILKNNR